MLEERLQVLGSKEETTGCANKIQDILTAGGAQYETNAIMFAEEGNLLSPITDVDVLENRLKLVGLSDRELNALAQRLHKEFKKTKKQKAASAPKAEEKARWWMERRRGEDVDEDESTGGQGFSTMGVA